jgi:aminoglycoside 6'-N-acetyltransferase
MNTPNTTKSNLYEDIETGLKVRLVTQEDMDILAKWFSDPILLESYGGPGKAMTYEQVKLKFFPNVLSNIQRCIIQHDQKPIGFIQIYELGEEEKAEYQYPENMKVFATDQFIAEETERGKGFGTGLIKSTVKYISSSFNPDRITLDPQTINERAIHVYEKCGYNKVRIVPQHDKYIYADGLVEMRDSWLMEYVSK